VTFLPVVFLVGALPITVAHLGTSQAAWIFFFSNYASEADLLAYSLVSHLTFMLANGTFGCSFCPRPTATSFSRSGSSRMLRPPAQEQEQSVEEHHVSCPSNPPAAAFPLHSQFEGNGSDQEVVDHPGGFAGPILHQAP
jgi:hypothetical protein